MGLGDEIMVTGEARRLQACDPRPIKVLDRLGRRRWHPLWQGNPRFWRPGMGPAQVLVNGPGCRPYIDYGAMARDLASVCPGRAFSTKLRDRRLPWRYTRWRATPGELHLPRLATKGYVVVEPHLKPDASPNKNWGWARWQVLVRLRDLPWVQLGPPGAGRLDGVRHLVTDSFAAACTVLSGAAAAVLPEGGLHHAAAALGVPAVVLFGGVCAPANTGYGGHVNLIGCAGQPCGQRVACAHCRTAMAAITPERVAEELDGIL